MSSPLYAVSLMLIMTIGLLLDARRTPNGRHETGDSLRQNALDPGFYGVLTGPARTNRDADGAGVS
jgi:hypothetical protein